MNRSRYLGLAIAVALAVHPGAPRDERAIHVIVTASSAHLASSAVREAGGSVTHELDLIDSVGAVVDANGLLALSSRSGIEVFEDGVLELAGKPSSASTSGAIPYTNYPSLVGADRVHAGGITGAGITIAVLDSGSWSQLALNKGASGAWRALAQYDAIADRLVASDTVSVTNDGHGHGTHVASIAASSANAGSRRDPRYNGIAPDAGLVSVRAFDDRGNASYADLIRGIEWVVSNKDRYGIRVLNCSFSAPARSPYWLDPVNLAVMKAWKAGIVVVASAGNRGPSPMSIGVPGNNPYVITVGAMTDNYTPANPDDDYLASFSSAGPTIDRFVKPDLVAPGGHDLGLMPAGVTLAVEHPEFHDGNSYFTMSGTSQAAAIASGTVALMLERDHGLSPDQVKFRLMNSARRGVSQDGSRVYTIFQQGAGMIDAYDSVHSSAREAANADMDIAADLAGMKHYSGLASMDSRGVYYPRGTTGDGYQWNGSYSKGAAVLWSDAILWSDAVVWSDAILWADAVLWSDAILWADAVLQSASVTGSPTTNLWVPQE